MLIVAENPLSFDLWTGLFGSWWQFGVALDIMLRVAGVCLVILRKGSRPQVAGSWVAVIAVLPFVGIFAYLLIGESRLGSRHRRVHKEVLARFERPEFHLHDDPATRAISMDPSDTQVARIAVSAAGSPPLAGNTADLFGDSAEAIAKLLEDIATARETVHLMTYIWLDDRVGEAVGDALVAATRRGVVCRVLVDSQGSRSFLGGRAVRTLRAHGVHIVGALPVHPLRMLFSRIDIRNHRKLAVIDGCTGWIGSMNIAAPEFAIQKRFAPWVDCMMRLEGPAVREIQLIFAEDWYLDTNESIEELLRICPPVHAGGLTAHIVASGPNYFNEAIRSLLVGSIQVADNEIVLTTPYFVPDQSISSALCVAAQRGVIVRLVVPRRNNSWLVALASRAGYSELLRSGVHIHEFKLGLLHAKTVTVDGKFGIVTSSNLDRRSFDLNFEATGLVYDDRFTRELRQIQQAYIDGSDEVSAVAWAKRPLRRRLAQNAAALISPLL